MTNTSATGGPLLPASEPAPLQDDNFANFMQALIYNLTGLDKKKVRPRWQPLPPNRPAIDEDWAAVGITDLDADTYAYQQHLPDPNGGDGANLLQRQEDVGVLTSFYGPNAMKNASLLRDGLALSQNRELLNANYIGLTEVGGIKVLPDLLNEKWYSRVDMPIQFKREVLRIYPIFNLLSAVGELEAEGSTLIIRPINVTQ